MKNIAEIPSKTKNPVQNNNGKGHNKKFTAPRIPVIKFGRERGNEHYTPWLTVRANYGDFGNRPLPAGTVFWESPDVWVQSSAGINQPVVGENNQVFARISNYGQQNASGVMVKFWWANPSMAITESTAHLIGIGYTDVPSGWSVNVQCPVPWVPVIENGGHECLIAEAFIPTFDPLTAPMDPLDDRHVGQKNEQLIMLQQGQSFITRVRAVNITAHTQELRFDIHQLHQTEIHPLLKLRAANLPDMLVPSTKKLQMGLDFDKAPSGFIKPAVLFTERLLLRGIHKIEEWLEKALEHSHVSHTARFEPWESRTLEISGKVPDDAEPGQTFLFRATQRIGNMVTGGYTVHVVVV
ncbi:MAG TPA: hypothetical protein VHA56_15055 [Mucilaginibacter sp.]|nr:hypothetical protein [Mucilaginibacter sp.]